MKSAQESKKRSPADSTKIENSNIKVNILQKEKDGTDCKEMLKNLNDFEMAVDIEAEVRMLPSVSKLGNIQFKDYTNYTNLLSTQKHISLTKQLSKCKSDFTKT